MEGALPSSWTLMLQMIFSYPTRGTDGYGKGERLVRQTVGASCVAASVGASQRWARLILVVRPCPSHRRVGVDAEAVTALRAVVGVAHDVAAPALRRVAVQERRLP